MSFTFEFGGESAVAIRVIGVGGGGGNAVNSMIASGIQGVDFIAINTDKQALSYSAATVKLQVGEKITGGRGAGSDPELGQKAAVESEDEVRRLLEGAHMCFITAGMGGGTGTGGAPVIADIAKKMGILTVGVVTRPFPYEGKQRILQAQKGIEALREKVDALVIIPNERLKHVSEQRITFINAFEIADNVLRQAVQSISELMTVPGLINLDFNDVSAIMKNAGYAHMGVGRASGKDKATEAARMAIESPLLETSIVGARGVLLNITGSPDMAFEEVEEAASMVQQAAHPEAHIIFGAAIDESMDDEMRITVVATGFDSKPTLPEPPVPQPEPVVITPEPQPMAQQPQPEAAPVIAAQPQTPGMGVRSPADVLRGEAVSATPAQPQAKPVPPGAVPEEPDDEDPFTDILKMFTNK